MSHLRTGNNSGDSPDRTGRPKPFSQPPHGDRLEPSSLKKLRFSLMHLGDRVHWEDNNQGRFTMKATDTNEFINSLNGGVFSQQLGRALSDVAAGVIDH